MFRRVCPTALSRAADWGTSSCQLLELLSRTATCAVHHPLRYHPVAGWPSHVDHILRQVAHIGF